jgi:hypothetical protein
MNKRSASITGRVLFCWSKTAKKKKLNFLCERCIAPVFTPRNTHVVQQLKLKLTWNVFVVFVAKQQQQ